MSEKLNLSFFENIICFNAFTDSAYLASIIDYFKPEYFENEDIKILLTKLIEYFERTSKLPNIQETKTFFENDTEQKRVETLVKIIQNNTEFGKLVKYDATDLTQKTEQFLREKAVYNAIMKSAKMASTGVVDTTQILDTFTEACNISLVDDFGFDYLEQIDDHVKMVQRPNNVIPSGWKFLDQKLGGGFQANGRALYVFAGGTNAGKSIFLGNLGINFLKQNKTVLLVTLEMPEELYAKRISSNITQIDFKSLSYRPDDLKSLLIDFKKDCNGKLIIKEFPTKGITVNHINSYIKKLLKRGIKPDILIVDYINLINSSKKSNNGTYDEIKDVAERLRALTYTFSIPCITATQLNRKGMDSANPSMDTTSESVGLPFTVDGQFCIWSRPEDKDAKMIHLSIQKNRYGENFGQTFFWIDYNTLTLKESNTDKTITNETINSTEASMNEISGVIGNI